MNKKSWTLLILVSILCIILSAVTYLFLTTDLFLQIKQLLQDTLKSTENNQFDSAKVYPYFLLLAITGLIYGIMIAVWQAWKACRQKSQCKECHRQRSPTFVHVHYLCHCDQRDNSIGYCYPVFREGRALQPLSAPPTCAAFFQPPPAPLPDDNLLGKA